MANTQKSKLILHLDISFSEKDNRNLFKENYDFKNSIFQEIVFQKLYNQYLRHNEFIQS